MYILYYYVTNNNNNDLWLRTGTPFIQSSCDINNLFYVHFNHKLSNICNTLSGYYRNVRGLKSKLSTVRINFASLNHYDYFILSETWLTNDIDSNELGMIDYILCFVTIEMI